MMQLVAPRSWKEEFAQAAASRREILLQNEMMRRLAIEDRERREEKLKEEREDEKVREIIEHALAPPAEIEAFTVQLDEYDAKTVEALMENREAMEIVQRRLDDMLGRAEVLPDGRRVFKTMDGRQVFDEHGQELSREEIDPDSIDDKKPKWETFRAATDEQTRLTREREQLLDYQRRLDEARERLDGGEITQKELDDMKADLSATMPDAVRHKLGLDKPKSDPAMERQANAPPAPDDMDQLMRRTGLGPSPMGGYRPPTEINLQSVFS